MRTSWTIPILLALTLGFLSAHAVIPPETLSPICEVQASVNSIKLDKISLTTIRSKIASQGFYQGPDNCSDVFKRGTKIEFIAQPFELKIITKKGQIVELPIQKQLVKDTRTTFYVTSDFSNYPNTHKVISEVNNAVEKNIIQVIFLKIWNFLNKLSIR